VSWKRVLLRALAVLEMVNLWNGPNTNHVMHIFALCAAVCHGEIVGIALSIRKIAVRGVTLALLLSVPRMVRDFNQVFVALM
jgi:hypothetical protein